jgi:hypothetical protein
MWDKTPAWKDAIEYRRTLQAMLIGLPLLAALTGWVWFFGHTERAVYLGPSPAFSGAAEARLRTEPDFNWVMARNGNYHALKAGCRYDFNYDPHFGRRTARGDHPERHVRKATLVDCP